MLGLNALQLRHAVGIAASTCGSLMANVGSMTKALHCGNAASNGLMAALLAKRGFTANTDVFDASNGFTGSLVPSLEESLLCDGDMPLMIENPGFAIKLFPSQYGTHFGITAALEADAEILESDQIESVELTTPEMGYVNRPLPQTGLEGKFSFQYMVALALLDRKVVIESFSDARLMAPEADAPANFEAMEVHLLVRLRGGRTIASHCGAPRGYLAKGPAFRGDDVLDKARNCLAVVLGSRDVEAVVAAAQQVDALSHRELQQMMSTLAGPAPSRTGFRPAN